VAKANSRWAYVFAGLGVAAAVGLGGCGGSQSTLNPHSPASRDIADLWWWMLAVATIVFLGAVVMLALAWRRRDRPGLPFFGENEKTNTRLVVAFGMVIPAIVLIALFAVANLYVLRQTEPASADQSAMKVEVIGHQWWWELRYPGTTAVSANEIHIPAGTDVMIVGRSADVIHSFWVPELNRKIDMIPGRTNRVVLHADQPGVYRGQCAEFCGSQHAHMVMKVFAQPPDQFRRWLARESRPAAPPGTDQARAGMQTFTDVGCAGCHTIRGTSAGGDVGPDLTHVASRTTIAGAIIENTPPLLREWIRDPQHIKPGNKMPALHLSDTQLDDLVAYLDGLH
jgi:cytochrome c oxidase subunit 2